jgi:hypothetical protein
MEEEIMVAIPLIDCDGLEGLCDYQLHNAAQTFGNNMTPDQLMQYLDSAGGKLRELYCVYGCDRICQYHIEENDLHTMRH